MVVSYRIDWSVVDGGWQSNARRDHAVKSDLVLSLSSVTLCSRPHNNAPKIVFLKMSTQSARCRQLMQQHHHGPSPFHDASLPPTAPLLPFLTSQLSYKPRHTTTTISEDLDCLTVLPHQHLTKQTISASTLLPLLH